MAIQVLPNRLGLPGQLAHWHALGLQRIKGEAHIRIFVVDEAANYRNARHPPHDPSYDIGAVKRGNEEVRLIFEHESTKTYFLRKNYEVYIAHTLTDGISRLSQIVPDFLFIDYNLPDGLGWDKLPELYHKYPDIQFHLISAFRPTMPSELDGAKLTIW